MPLLAALLRRGWARLSAYLVTALVAVGTAYVTGRDFATDDLDALAAEQQRSREELTRLRADVDSLSRQLDSLETFVWRLGRAKTAHLRPDPFLDAPPPPPSPQPPTPKP